MNYKISLNSNDGDFTEVVDNRTIVEVVDDIRELVFQYLDNCEDIGFDQASRISQLAADLTELELQRKAWRPAF